MQPVAGGRRRSLKSALRTWSFVDFTLLALRLLVVFVVVGGTIGTFLQSRYSAEQWFNIVMFGLTLGGVYALIALGYTMVYGVLRMINFAHGDFMMVGSFAGYFVASAVAANGMLDTQPAVALAFIFAVAMAASASVAMASERFAYRHFRGALYFTPLIAAIGVSFLLQQTVRGAFGSGVRSYPDPNWLDGTYNLFGFDVPKVQPLVIIAAIVTMIALYLVVHRTKMGKAMRAVSEDPRAAALMGIDVNRVIVFTFMLGGMLAGVAGVFYGFVYKQVHFFMGFAPGVKAFGAAVLGGIGNIPGAMLGGILLGLGESVGPTLFLDGLGIPAPYQLRDLIAFTILIMVLIFRPHGILGERVARIRA